MDEKYIKKVTSLLILVILIVLSFLLLRPILLSIIVGIILAFIFSPIYNWLYRCTKIKNLSAGILVAVLLILIILPIWFLTPILVDQSIKIYTSAQQADFVTPLKTVFPDLFASEEFSAEVGSIVHSFVTRIANYFVNAISGIILNFPVLFLKMLVVFFTFFFVLRDKEKIIQDIKSILPFSRSIKKRLFDSSKAITGAVIYGQVIIGSIQGVVLGIGLFIFRVPNALILTAVSILAGIFPIIGTGIVWIPLTIYLVIAGNTLAAIGVLLFGIISSSLDNFIRPIIVSKRTELNSSIILIGMIGGLFLFGILGVILGPLILAYLLILLELYRTKKVSETSTRSS